MMTLRQKIAHLLEANRPDGKAGRLIDLFLIALILANVGLALMATVPEFRASERRFLYEFEIFSVTVFSIEYLLRLWSCVDKARYRGMSALKARLKWMFSPLGLIDLLAIIPFYVLLLFPASSHSALLLRLFRGMRLLRVFKLTRYSPALQILRNVIKEEGPTLFVVAIILGIILLLASWGIYVLESDVQPEHFGSIPHAMWWAVVSLTTVGYGDVVPVTTYGKIFAGIIALVGIGTMALPAGILASGFNSEMRRREHAYNRALTRLMQDGMISENEHEQLEQLREELGLSEEDAQSLMLDARRAHARIRKCPHCGERLHK